MPADGTRLRTNPSAEKDKGGVTGAGGDPPAGAPAAGHAAAAEPDGIPLSAERTDMLELQARVLRIWERKFVVLSQNSIKFYRPAKAGEPAPHGKLLLELPCDKITAVVGPTTDNHILFLQTGQFSGYKLKCYTAKRAADWKRAITYRALKKDK